MSDQSSESQSLNWRKACEAAQREVEPVKLSLLIGVAEEAIFLRLQQTEEKLTQEEREAINDATRELRRLQVERLNFPRWEAEI
jgi:hypothetical protein